MATTAVYAHNKVVVVPLGDAFERTKIIVSEDSGNVVIPLKRSGGSAGQLSVFIETIDGSAKSGQDYGGLNSPLEVIWIDGDTSQRTVSFGIIADNLSEGDETFRLRISSANPDWVSDNNELIVVIEDSPTGKVNFELDSYASFEQVGSVTLRLLRLGGDAGEINVDVETFDGSALSGSDYQGLAAPVNIAWPDGNATERTIQLPIIADSVTERIEEFSVAISSANPDWVGEQNRADVSIRDSIIISVAAGKIRLSSPTMSVSESQGAVTLSLERFSGSFGALAVNVSTEDGTAVNGEDYTGLVNPISVVWGSGDTTTKTITLPIQEDVVFEQKETFTLNITGDNVGFPASATITIRDSPPGQIGIGDF